MILRILVAFLLLQFVLSEETQDTVPSFDQFVYTYRKQYKEDEYAYASEWLSRSRDRRVNYAENVKRMLRAQKLSGMPLQINYYADYSEVRFRKMLMSNNDYSNLQLNEFEKRPPEEELTLQEQSWSFLIPETVNVDPLIKCASSWAVAVTTYMYMKYKEQDPLWTVVISSPSPIATILCSATARLRNRSQGTNTQHM